MAPLDEPGSPEKATERQSVFTMVNAVLGAGVLGYPFCYKVRQVCVCMCRLQALLIVRKEVRHGVRQAYVAGKPDLLLVLCGCGAAAVGVPPAVLPRPLR